MQTEMEGAAMDAASRGATVPKGMRRCTTSTCGVRSGAVGVVRGGRAMQTGGREMSKATYRITVGEVGNEIGHVNTSWRASDLCAIRAAKRRCAAYKGDGWWVVQTAAGYPVARGGRR
jgi:hypothetical protein